MKILVTAATSHELSLLSQQLNSGTLNNDHDVILHKTGIGMLATAFNLLKLIPAHQPDLVMQVGIAGSFMRSLTIGSVIAVDRDYVADLGVEEDGTFKDVFEMGLEKPNDFPFRNGSLRNPWLNKLDISNIEFADAVTINQITTAPARVAHLSERYRAAIESMEGAALHYVCLQTETPFLQLRSVSNYVGERDKHYWNIGLALENLTASVNTFINRQTDLITDKA